MFPGLMYLLITLACSTVPLTGAVSALAPADSVATSLENPVPGDVLTMPQKINICSLPKVEELCPTAGSGDAVCVKLASTVAGKDPRCDLKHVCSFEMPPNNKPPAKVDLPHHSPTTEEDPIVKLRRAPNRAYVTIEDWDDLILAKTCEKNGLYIFVPEFLVE